MTEERRYQEEEIAEIFEVAATSETSRRKALSPAHGLTLAELQAIARDVGVAPERIAEAAAALELRQRAEPRRTNLGLPISVGRSVDLPRAPSDREWQLLLGELRGTFHARGRDRSEGGVRAWTNGNLHADIEPTESGYRLRIGSVKGDAIPLNTVGVLSMLFGLILLADLLFVGVFGEELSTALLLGVTGAAMFAANAVRLPRWALEREEQMDYIVARAQRIITAADAGVPEGEPSERE